MKTFDLYLFRNLAVATAFLAVVLTLIIFLTQSLRFLEIVMNAGSSGHTFWIITFLALPRFFEVILPISLMIATLFVYNKLTLDSELIAIRGMGRSPFDLGKPAMALGLIMALVLWGITMWGAPISLARMQQMRQELKAEFSNFIFKESVFNPAGKGLTVYISEKRNDGELLGLMIHDTHDPTKLPSTVLAKRGMIVSTPDGHQVIVFDGSRQEYNPVTATLQKLAFDRYTIDLPENKAVSKRWAEPDERTINQLLRPDKDNVRDLENMHEFNVEIHRRFTSPLLAMGFPLIALISLLLGSVDRRGQAKRIAAAIIIVILIQGLFLASYNLARNNNFGLILMYVLSFVPIGLGLFFLDSRSENTRQKLMVFIANITAKTKASTNIGGKAAP
ncbi:MAG: LPS export ABC transporter permease LptF [Alphaproteobacteria bacterium]|nr:LPS export ABC transporter permease LptF [Alphaproteobacteria bacterium]